MLGGDLAEPGARSRIEVVLPSDLARMEEKTKKLADQLKKKEYEAKKAKRELEVEKSKRFSERLFS